MKVAKEFSRFAKAYSRHNIIQSEVAKKLVSMLPKTFYDTVLDLGCGPGEVWKNLKARDISCREFTAMDISEEMLSLHPRSKEIKCIRGDFNDPALFRRLPSPSYDLVISSSALQWSSDLDRTLPAILALSDRHYYAIFTSNTFRTLHEYASIDSPIYSDTYLRTKIGQYCDAVFETVRYKLHFDTVYEMLRYIKESGTSGGERKLGYKQTKHLIDTYPHTYLEFEILFVTVGR